MRKYLAEAIGTFTLGLPALAPSSSTPSPAAASRTWESASRSA